MSFIQKYVQPISVAVEGEMISTLPIPRSG